MTSTHTHVLTRFANPFLRCDFCKKPVTGFVAFFGQVLGCDHVGNLYPCGHIGATSICPSWSPVDGCRCANKITHEGFFRAQN